MLAERSGHDLVEGAGIAVATGASQESLCLGADMVDPPFSASVRHRGDDRLGLFVDPFGGDGGLAPTAGLAGDIGDQTGQFALAANDFDGLGEPGVALFAKAAGSVFCLAGIEGRLLGEREHFHGVRFASVLGLKGLRQVGDTVFDRGTPG